VDKQDIKVVLEQLGDAESIRLGLERFSADVRYRNENFYALLEQYPNKWIAILNQEVVAVSTSLKGLGAKLKKEGIDSRICLWDFLDTDPKPQILMSNQASNTRLFYILDFSLTI